MAQSTIEAIRKRSRELGMKQSRFVEDVIREKLDLGEHAAEQQVAPKIRCS